MYVIGGLLSGVYFLRKMQAVKEAISVRVTRINSEITGKLNEKNLLLNREVLLDALQVLYDECSLESMQKGDSNIAEFVKKYQEAIKDIKTLRINISDFEIKNVIGKFLHHTALFYHYVGIVCV